MNWIMKNDPPSQPEERLQQSPNQTTSTPGVRGANTPSTTAPAPNTRPKRPPRGDEEPFAMVVLPSKPSSRHSKPLPPPGGAQRVTGGAPVPPPRPEHTLSLLSRPIVANKVAKNNNNNTLHHLPSSQMPASMTTSGHVPVTSGSHVTNLVSGSGIMELVSLPNRTVSLTAPRSEQEREKNLYTEAPQKVLPHTTATQQPQTKQPLLSVIQNQPIGSSSSLAKKAGHGGKGTGPAGGPLAHDLLAELDDLVIMSDPNGLKAPNGAVASAESIFCQNCGKCKCEACCRPRKLPQKWLCKGTFLCSKTTVVDSLSCMCCVKGLFYHCTKDMEDDLETSSDLEANTEVVDEDHPCTCQGPHALKKWACMAMLIPVLPCLLTYPLLGACASCAEHVYARVTASGCQCQKPGGSSATPPVGPHDPRVGLNPRSLQHPIPPLLTASSSEKKSAASSTHHHPESLSRPMLCSSVSTALSSKSP